MWWFKNKTIKDQNRVILSLNEFGKVVVSLEIDTSSIKSAEIIAELLFALCNGGMYEPVAAMLVDLGSNNPKYYNITESILSHWLRKTKETDLKHNEPFIDPLKVFAQSQ